MLLRSMDCGRLALLISADALIPGRLQEYRPDSSRRAASPRIKCFRCSRAFADSLSARPTTKGGYPLCNPFVGDVYAESGSVA